MSKYLARLLALDSLEALKREMRRLEVDKGGIPIMSTKGVQRLVLVEQVPTAAANCIKQEILARGGDLITPWSASGFEAPFVDVIFIGNLTTLRSTLSKLYRQRVYDLPLIADAVQAVLVRTTPGYLPVAPQPNRQGVVVEETLEDLLGGRIPLQPGTNRATGRPTLVPVPDHPSWRFGELTYVVGTVGDTADPWACVQQAVGEGAHMVEIGDHAVPLIKRIREAYPKTLIAVAASRARAAEEALKAGAHIVRGGKPDPELHRVAAAYGVPMVLMHSQAEPGSRDLLTDVSRFFYEAMNEAVAAGVREEQIILDAGLGLGKTVHQDLELTRRLRELTSFGRPLSVGPDDAGDHFRDTGAAATVAIANGADFIRVRHVPVMARCAATSDALLRGAPGPDQ